jgi:ketosteroid isomerase-like protein
MLAWGHGPHAHPPESQAKPAEPKPEEPILKVLADYRAAMEVKSIEKLAAVMDPNLLILEGIHTNTGWADYRDNHIGPEMKEWKEFKVADPKVLEVAVAGDFAYVVEQTSITIVMADNTVVIDAAETFVLRKGPEGWKIKHLHYSGKPRANSPPATAPAEKH